MASVECPACGELQKVVVAFEADHMRTLASAAMRVVTGGVPYGCMAFVTNDTTSFGIARMFGILIEDSGLPVQVFHDLDEAEQWLDARACRDASPPKPG
jgi:hypothetical protein